MLDTFQEIRNSLDPTKTMKTRIKWHPEWTLQRRRRKELKDIQSGPYKDNKERIKGHPECELVTEAYENILWEKGILVRWFKFTLEPPYTKGFGNFFLAIWDTFQLEFFCQIWTQDTLWHLLGLFLVKFEICQFLASPGPFEILAKMGTFTKSTISQKWCTNFCSFRFNIRSKDEWATWWDHFGWGVTHLSGHYGSSKWALWFLAHLQHFKGHVALTYFIKNQSLGVA